ncbi:MAG: hypothetical protein IPG05_15885 [Gemmatimonadetes bacterium]|nr:hypothetical protein [Gemmatimonadota bacterium]
MFASPILLLALAVGGPGVSPGEAVVKAAYAKYAGKWPTSFTYLQKTVLPDGRKETWYHAVKLPGLLRIDVAPDITGRAILYRNDSLYSYGAKQMKTRSWWPNSFLVLTGDLHVAPPAETIKRLRAFGFNLDITHEESVKGVKYIVVGAKQGDLRSKQFWLEKERMIVMRLIEPNGADPSRPMEAQFTKYTRLGGGWIEGFVLITLGGQPTQVEERYEIKNNAKIDPAIFLPGPYRLPAWVGSLADVYGTPTRIR